MIMVVGSWFLGVILVLVLVVDVVLGVLVVSSMVLCGDVLGVSIVSDESMYIWMMDCSSMVGIVVFGMFIDVCRFIVD